MTHADPPDKSLASAAIARRMEEMQKLRREAYATIKALDRDIAVMAAALRVFDPDGYVAKAVAAARDRKRGKVARRVVLDILRQAEAPMDSRQIADAWMERDGIADTPENQRAYRTRARATLTNARVTGIAESEQADDGMLVWRLSDRS